MKPTAKKWKDNIYFILVEPGVPGNVGSAARAIKNMGFRNLEMVNPTHYFTEETKWLAHNSFDIVEKAKVYHSFVDAIHDKSIVIGTTRRHGKNRGLMLPMRHCAGQIVDLAGNNKIAIVFGREDKGLTNNEVEQCGYLVTIPTHCEQPSLNLAQSVLVVSYELSMLEPSSNFNRLVSQKEILSLLDRVTQTIQGIGYIPRGSRDLETKILMNIKHLIGRSGLTDWELNMIHGICVQIDKKMNKNEES